MSSPLTATDAAASSPSWSDDARLWCRGRLWPPRAALLLLLAADAQRVIRAPEAHAGLFGGITLPIHEGGHVLFSVLGEWWGIAGGSLTQVLAPLVAGWLLVRQQRDWFGLAVALLWLAASLGGLALYVGDARAMELPLVGIGDGEPLHDWNYLLGHAGLLARDAQAAALVRDAAWLAWGAGAALGGWLCEWMRRQPAAADATPGIAPPR